MATRSPAWDRPDEFDHVLLVADDEPAHLEALCDRLAQAPGRHRADVLGRYPRFRIVTAEDGEQALARVTDQVSVAAIDLMLPRRSGIEVIQELRSRRPDLAILAFTAAAPASEAIAAMMAGADHFHEYSREGRLEHAVDLAIDRRRLTRLIEHDEAEVDEARKRLARLAGPRGTAMPGFRPPLSAAAIIPFDEAARHYLEAAVEFFPQDPQGLARRLGVSYFALRRLCARYGVECPARYRKGGTRKS